MRHPNNPDQPILTTQMTKPIPVTQIANPIMNFHMTPQYRTPSLDQND